MKLTYTFTLASYLTFLFAHTLFSTTISTKQLDQADSTQLTNIDQQCSMSIHLAAFEGRVNVLRYFIEQKKIDPNIRDEHNLTPFHYGVIQGHLPIVEYLTSLGCDVCAWDGHGAMPIHIAALHGHTNILRHLIEKCHIARDIRDMYNLTPLHCAVINGHLPAVEYLIKQNCDVHARDTTGAMPIHFAALNGHVHILKHFIERNYTNKDTLGPDNQTPLHYAALTGQLPAVNYLVRQKTNITARDIHGSMPIHLAALKGHTNVLKYLIEEGHADKNALGPNKHTPLHYAAQNGHLTAVEYLMTQKCNVHAQDTTGSMPIHLAAMAGHIHVLRHLIEEGNADKNAPGPFKHTPLHYASLNGHLTAVEYLTKKQCDVHVRNIMDIMPIHFAAIEGHTDILKCLIEEGHADKNAPGPDYQTPLHCAALSGHLSAADYLIKQGACLETRNKKGQTPLSCAWEHQHADIVNLMTGLALTYDKHGMLLPVSNPCESNEIPEWKKLMCIKHAGQLPFHIETLAQEIAVNLGEKDIFFYHTSDKRSHATGLGFKKIGLSTKTILTGIKYIVRKSVFKRFTKKESYNSHEKYFKNTLYHELCHITADDTATYYKEKILKTDIAALTREMAAELGAMYYLYTIDKQVFFPDYLEDKEHPSRNELWRYIAQLYAQLLENPEADFTIVEELAKLYLQEKNTQTRMVKNSILPIARKLHENGMLNTQEYTNICMSLKRGY